MTAGRNKQMPKTALSIDLGACPPRKFQIRIDTYGLSYYLIQVANSSYLFIALIDLIAPRFHENLQSWRSSS